MFRLAPRRASWGSLFRCVVVLLVATPPNAHAARNTTGRWYTSDGLGVTGTHVTLLRNPNNRAKVFLFGGSGGAQVMKTWNMAATADIGDAKKYVPLPSSLTLIPHPVGANLLDLFCDGHATTADGKMLLIGGGTTIVPNATPAPKAHLFTPQDSGGVFTQMNAAAMERWYPAALALGDGTIAAFAGARHGQVATFGGDVLSPNGINGEMWPLHNSARSYWGSTTTRKYNPFGPNSQFPGGRVGHALAGNDKGFAVLFGGFNGTAVVDSAFVMNNGGTMDYANLVIEDTLYTWRNASQVADASNSPAVLPGPRRDFAMVWAGLDGGQGNTMGKGGNDTVAVVYMFGGRDTSNQVLGDVWRGVLDLSAPGAKIRWTRIWKGDETNYAFAARYGHRMVYDPGPSSDGNTSRARLLVFGGRDAAGNLADGAVWAFTIGSNVRAWRQIIPSGSGPVAREGHVTMTEPKPITAPAKRRHFVFGGAGLSSGSEVLLDDLWKLQRNDAGAADTTWAWELLSLHTSTKPSARTRAAGYYLPDGQRLIINGGDTQAGSGTTLSSETWMIHVNETSSVHYEWDPMPLRAMGSTPPARAGHVTYFPVGIGNTMQYVEKFDPALGTGGAWTTLGGPQMLNSYPHMVLLPDGRAFNTGPPAFEQTNNPYKRYYNFTTQSWEGTPSLDAIAFGTAAMYAPGKLLRCGAHGDGDASNGVSNTETITIASGQSGSDWAQHVPANPFQTLKPRANHNLTILPTGDVLASGGISHPPGANDTSYYEREPQIWLAQQGRWTSTRPLDNELLDPDPRPRNYHSSALLLPDGRVLTTGGEFPNTELRKTVSLFEPPYLFDASGNYRSRPAIDEFPEELAYGTSYGLRVSGAPATRIASVVLMRPSSATHQFNFNQRYVPLTFQPLAGSDLLVTAPPNADEAPPGDYMLFICDSLGTGMHDHRIPSIAKWVRVKAMSSPPADSLRPNKITITDGCADGNTGDVQLTWTEAPDDLFAGDVGAVQSIEIKYKAGFTSPDTTDWNTGWSLVSTTSWPIPGAQGTSHTEWFSGLPPETKLWFRMKAVDAGGFKSRLSNAVMVWTADGVSCGGGGSGGGGGGGGSRAGRANGALSMQSGSGFVATENSLFDVPEDGVAVHEALRIEGGGMAASQPAWFHTSENEPLSLDRVTLAVLDHAEGTEAFVAGDAIVQGMRETIASATLTGEDVLASVSGTGEGIYALPGDTLTLDLGAGSSAGLVVEARRTGGVGPREVTGIEVQGESSGTWSALVDLYPHAKRASYAVATAGAHRVRLVFRGGAEISRAERLVPSGTCDVSEVALAAASRSGGSIEAAALSAADGSAVSLPGDDSLTFVFDVPDLGQGLTRSVFLKLVGTRPGAPRSLSQLARQTEPRAELPTRFALHAPTPNPTRGGVEIRFDVPRNEFVELLVFDPQGRIIYRQSARFAAGRHSVEWLGRDAQGVGATPGLYFARLSAGKHSAGRKFVVMP